MSSRTNGIATSLLPEFDLEMANTRKVLERVPEADFAWRPHAKSFSMGELAGHVASIPGWMTSTLVDDAFDVSPGGVPASFPKAATVKEAVAMFDEGVPAARAALEAASDAAFLESWSLLASGEPLFTMPRVAVVRSFVMNHLIHHRAQLCVYLRLKDVPVPALYGPSADEQG
ncbi:MAG: DinB family protein [Holophagales bacterium]|nr:DinB family protein [Holophagales bacterium]